MRDHVDSLPLRYRFLLGLFVVSAAWIVYVAVHINALGDSTAEANTSGGGSLSAGSWITTAGSPVTTSGTLSLDLITADAPPLGFVTDSDGRTEKIYAASSVMVDYLGRITRAATSRGIMLSAATRPLGEAWPTVRGGAPVVRFLGEITCVDNPATLTTDCSIPTHEAPFPWGIVLGFMLGTLMGMSFLEPVRLLVHAARARARQRAWEAKQPQPNGGAYRESRPIGNADRVHPDGTVTVDLSKEP